MFGRIFAAVLAAIALVTTPAAAQPYQLQPFQSVPYLGGVVGALNNCNSVVCGPTGGVPNPDIDLNFAAGTNPIGCASLAACLTITNSTGGYVTNWDGSITWKFGPIINLVPWSQDFTNASWLKRGVNSVGTGVLAPDGTLTANKLNEDATNSNHDFRKTISKAASALPYVAQSYFQAVERTWAILTVFDGVSVSNTQYVNLSNCTAGTSATSGGGFSGAVASVTSAGNGYCLASISFTSTSTTGIELDVGAAASNGSNFYVGTLNSGVNIWGAQLAAQSYPTQTSANPYVATTSGTATSTAQLRIGTGNGILSEDPRNNLVQYSELLSNSYWGKSNINVTDAQTTAPNGSLTGELVARSSTVANGFVTSTGFSSTPSTTYTFYRIVKPATIDGYYGMRIQGVYPNRADALFNINTCSKSGAPASTTFTAPSSGAQWLGSWCLVWLTTTIDAGTSSLTAVHGPTCSTATVTGWEIPCATLSNAYSWGGNFTQSDKVLSYCPTTSAQATCSGDNIVAAGTLDTLFRSQTGTAAAGFSISSVSAGALPRLYDENNAANSLFLNIGSAFMSNNYNGSASASATANYVLGSVGRAASSWSQGAQSVVFNGGTVANGSAAGPFTAGTTYIGNRSALDRTLNGYITRLQLWSTKLTESQLAITTTPQPVLFTDFANGLYTWNGYNLGAGALTSLFSVANSGGYCTNGSGQLVGPFAANTLRVCAGTGALPEDTRTYNFIQSQNFSNAAWGRNNTSVGGASVSAPDPALTTTDLVIPNTNVSVHTIAQSVAVTTGNTYAVACYVRPAGYTKVGIRENTSSGAYASYNLAGAGSVISSSGAGVTTTITALANSWYRFTWTYAPIASSTQSFTFFQMDNGYVSGAFNGYTYAGDGVSGIYFWGCQHELGTFPTSYYPTTTVALTRNFDNIQALGPVLNLLGTQGANAMTAAWQGSPYYGSGAAPSRQNVATWLDSGNLRWAVRGADVTTTTNPNFIVGDGAATSTLNTTNFAAGTAMKMAWRWNTAAADAAAVINGSSPATAARQLGGTIAAPVYIGSNGGSALSVPLSSLGFYPGGLTNTQLQTAP